MHITQLAGAALALALAWAALDASSARGQQGRLVPVEMILAGSRRDAETILIRLKAGGDFGSLARQFSIDSSSDQNGYLGMVDPLSLRPELGGALEHLEPGEVSGIVQVPAGYAILRIRKEAPNGVQGNATAGGNGMGNAGAPPDVRLTPDTSGYMEFYQAFRNKLPKDGSAGLDLKAVCATREQAPLETIAAMQKYLAEQGPRMEPLRLSVTQSTLALLWSSLGHLENAAPLFEEAYRNASGSEPDQRVLEEAIGSIYLHRASAAEHVGDFPVSSSFLFPTHPGAMHPNPGDLEKAIEYLSRAFRRDPSNLEIRFLLNVAYMTAGTYPSGVPAEALIPPRVFASEEDLGLFVDVAPAAGVAQYGTSGGAIADDFDNDGLIDIVTSQVDDCAPLHFFHNNGDGTFSDRTAQAGLLDQTGGLNIIQADYNNDGCIDLLVLRGGWEFPRRLSLLRNNCNGTFTDVTAESGLLTKPIAAVHSAAWADIDNDGNLDLFVANENAPSQLFLNKGDGTFVDISRRAGIDRVAFSKGVVAADYDNDGYPDFYVSNFNGANFLYHNNGDKTFTEVAAAAGVQFPRFSFATWFFDYDNDGWPDLFVTSDFRSVEESVRSYMKLPHKGETLKLYKNMRNGTFRDVTEEVGLDRIFMPMGAGFGDIDNDGYLDVYLGMGNPSFVSLLPNVLLHNQQGKRFADISASSGTGALAKGHGVAFADFNNDGDEDLFVEMGGAEAGDSYTSRLFVNPGGHGNDWITLRLVGVKSNRMAVGARISVSVQNEGRERRKICRTVGSGGSFGSSPFQQHIGLGKSARIESIDIWWPTSDTRQHFTGVQPNQFLEIREFATSPVKLERRPFAYPLHGPVAGQRSPGNP